MFGNSPKQENNYTSLKQLISRNIFKRLFTVAIIAATTNIAIFLLGFILLTRLNLSICRPEAELAIIFCSIIILYILLPFALLVALIINTNILKRVGVQSPFVIVLFSTSTALVVFLLSSYIQGNLLVISSFFVLFISAFYFYYWLFNLISLKKRYKVFTAILIQALLLIIVLFVAFPNLEGSKNEKEFKKLNFQIYAPKEIDEGGSCYKLRAYIKDPVEKDDYLQMSFKKTPSVFQFKVKSNFRPPNECWSPFPSLEGGGYYSGSCELFSITPRGYKIYKRDKDGSYFILIGETLITLTGYSNPPINKEGLTRFIDSFEPATGKDLTLLCRTIRIN